MRLRRCHLLLASFAVTGVAATAVAEPATKEVEVNGVKMSYVEEGTGEPVVFIHGAAGDARVWEPFREAIADEQRFIAPTLRYFGTDEWPDEGGQFGVATHADDVATFIRALDIGPVHLVGWSYGSDVATVAALENPDLVQTVVLFEPALSSLIEEGEAGKAAGEAAGQMFGPVTTAVQEGNAEEATRLLIEACSRCRLAASTTSRRKFRGYSSTMRGRRR